MNYFFEDHRMTGRRNEIHANLVDHWYNKNAKGLTPEKLVQLYEQGIHAVKLRSLVTLSNVTLLVVLERALHESTEKFPILSEINADSEKIDLSSTIRENGHHKPEEVQAALRHLLVEILNVLGNITADILTAPLHSELMKISSDTLTAPPVPAKSSGKLSREES